MAKRFVGIDIGPGHLRAVQILKTDSGLRIENTFVTHTRRATDSLREMLTSLYSTHGLDKRAPVAVSMPHDAVFFRNIETGSAASLRDEGCAALENSFPIQPGRIVARACSAATASDERQTVLTAAVSIDSLNDRLSTLTDANIRPRLVEAPIFAVYCAVLAGHPEAAAGNAVIACVDCNRFVMHPPAKSENLSSDHAGD